MTAWKYTMIGMMLAISPAWADSQSKDQQSCINFLNGGMAKVVSQQLKASAKCIDAYARDKIETNAELCLDDATGVFKALDKVLEGGPAKCATQPTIGPWDASYVAYQVRGAATLLLIDLVGSLETELLKCSDPPEEHACKCQSTVAKTVAKLSSFYWKGFNKCKKSGLKAEGGNQIVDGAGLIACLVDPIKFDPKAKHAKLVEKTKAAIAKGCSPLVTNPLPNSDECQSLSGDALATCIDQRTRCHVCATLNDVDGINLYESCDTFDDGLVNSSCHGA
ncbi:MAG TPA: hypothetical protein VEB21_01150 [Terriglobales bacterium]|nr:hypothetical protein [Terriglobales bacterium]